MYYNIALGDAKKLLFFIKKNLFNAGTGMGRGYPNPSETGMRFNFSSPLDMSRVTGKYMRFRYGGGQGKTRPHPAPLSCQVWKYALKNHQILNIQIMQPNNFYK